MYDPKSLENLARKLLFELEKEDHQRKGLVFKKSTGLANANPKFSKNRRI